MVNKSFPHGYMSENDCHRAFDGNEWNKHWRNLFRVENSVVTDELSDVIIVHSGPDELVIIFKCT